MTINTFLLRYATYTPDAPAVITPERRFSYRNLADAAAAYAEVLATAGLERGDRLLALLEPGFEAIALLCACARSGVIWVPASSENPAARLGSVIDAVSPRVIVTATTDCPLSGAQLQARAIAHYVAAPGSLEWRGGQRRDATGETACVIPLDPAYVVFTSGSTGVPKGIVMTHQATIAFWEGMIEFNALSRLAVVGSFAPIQFDFWLLDVGCALGCGAAIAFIPRASFFQPRHMARHLQSCGVTQMNGVPSIWTSLLAHAEDSLRAVTSLTSILFAGDRFPFRNLQQLREIFPHLRIINCFGQSESIACAFADLPDPLPANGEQLSFGRGHKGVELFALDADGRRILAPQIVGELYLRAPNLFSGYWNDPAASANALVPHPLQPESGERVFKTGDLVARNEAGDFYFVGRKDDQVKVMGNRVEPGEVAAVIRRVPGVANAVVVPIDADSSTILVAHVVPAPAADLNIEHLRAACSESLPHYMLPAEFVLRPVLPTTENGKIDNHQLRREWLSQAHP